MREGDDLHAWLAARRAESGLDVRRVRLADCADWALRDGQIAHRSGRYFQVTGLRAHSGAYNGWEQPVLRQEEVGILGFIVRTGVDGSEWLAQAKSEPGNSNGTQVAPTVQATQSNYERVHGGAPTRYLEWFTGGDAGDRRSDVLASEQGTRFLNKCNRNLVVTVPAAASPAAVTGWRWVDASALRTALRKDLTVNTDARSVLATGPWELLADDGQPFAGDPGPSGLRARLARSYGTPVRGDDTLERVRELRDGPRADAERVPVEELAGWRLDEWGLRPVVDGGVGVECVAVSARDREVANWCQPLLTAAPTTCDLWCQERAGVLQFLFRWSAEPGLRSAVELGPSHQSDALPASPPATGAVRLSVLQSDEGGRFLRSECRYRVVELPGPELETPPDATWLSLADVAQLARHSGTFTNEARSALSLLLSLA